MDKTKTIPSIKTICGKLINIVIIIFILFCLWSLFSIYQNKKDTSFFGFRSFIVLTGSMNPTFNAGSYIVVREKKPENIKIGNIISYKVDSKTVLTHRVVEIIQEQDGYLFLTKGDANNMLDKNPVRYDQVEGVVIFWVNGLGTFFTKLKEPRVLFAISLLLCVLLAVTELYGWFHKRKKRKE